MRSVSSSRQTSKGWAELGQRLLGHTIAHAVVLGDSDLLLLAVLVLDDGLDGNNLAVEFALLLSLGGLLERACCKGILALAVNVEILGNILGRDSRRKI